MSSPRRLHFSRVRSTSVPTRGLPSWPATAARRWGRQTPSDRAYAAWRSPSSPNLTRVPRWRVSLSAAQRQTGQPGARHASRSRKYPTNFSSLMAMRSGPGQLREAEPDEELAGGERHGKRLLEDSVDEGERGDGEHEGDRPSLAGDL